MRRQSLPYMPDFTAARNASKKIAEMIRPLLREGEATEWKVLNLRQAFFKVIIAEIKACAIEKDPPPDPPARGLVARVLDAVRGGQEARNGNGA